VLTRAGGRDQGTDVDGDLGTPGRIPDRTGREHPDRAARELGTQPGDELTSGFEPMTYVDCAADHDRIGGVEVVNRVRLSQVDLMPGGSEALGDNATVRRSAITPAISAVAPCLLAAVTRILMVVPSVCFP
jgi:hypothetical protein